MSFGPPISAQPDALRHTPTRPDPPPGPAARAALARAALVVLALGLAGCGGQGSSTTGLSDRDSGDRFAAAPMAQGGDEAAEGESSADYVAAEAPAQEKADGSPPDTGSPTGGGSSSEALAQDAAVFVDNVRKIVKDAQMAVRVDDVASGVARLETVAAQSGGYVLETRTDYDDPAHRTAKVRLAVPVANFETALERIRAAALAVERESATGADVSQEVVDLTSQIANLEATAARVRAFLDRAEDVEAALKVNAELTRLDGEIALRKGRLAFLEQRAAYSTITVDLTEPTPDWTPTATATPSPTGTPLPTATPIPWRPGETLRDASSATLRLGRGLVELGIWLVVFVLPYFAVLGLFLWLGYRLVERYRDRPKP